MTLLSLLSAVLRFEQQELPYCARCGGHFPPHGH